MQVEPCAFKDHEYHKNYLWIMNHLVSNKYMVTRYIYNSIVGGTKRTISGTMSSSYGTMSSVGTMSNGHKVVEPCKEP